MISKNFFRERTIDNFKLNETCELQQDQSDWLINTQKVISCVNLNVYGRIMSLMMMLKVIFDYCVSPLKNRLKITECDSFLLVRWYFTILVYIISMLYIDCSNKIDSFLLFVFSYNCSILEAVRILKNMLFKLCVLFRVNSVVRTTNHYSHMFVKKIITKSFIIVVL